MSVSCNCRSRVVGLRRLFTAAAAETRLSLDSDAAAESLKKSVTQSPPDEEENDGSSVPSPQDKTDNGPSYIPV